MNQMASRKKVILAAVDEMIHQDPLVQDTFETLCRRPLSKKEAREEIARAFLGCMFEAGNGLPNRWDQVLQGLQHGRSASELFPDTLYGGPS